MANVDEDSTTITNRLMGNISYDHSNWKKLIFKDVSSDQQDENLIYAEDNFEKEESEQVPDDVKKKVIQPSVMSEDDRYKAKLYDFNRYRKFEHKTRLRQINQNKQKATHTFLSSLRAKKDRMPNYKTMPSTYRILQKNSNLSGKFMSTQAIGEPLPFLEIGDLAHRLVYLEKSLLSEEEQDLISVKPLGYEVGPVESMELCRVLLGLQVTSEVFRENKAEHAVLGKFMNSVVLSY